MLKHDKRHTCDIPSCPRAAVGAGFTTINDLNRHKKSVHRVGGENRSYRCASESCRNKDKIWPRLDNFKQHICRMHKGEDEDDLIRRSICKDHQLPRADQDEKNKHKIFPGTLPPAIYQSKGFGHRMKSFGLNQVSPTASPNTSLVQRGELIHPSPFRALESEKHIWDQCLHCHETWRFSSPDGTVPTPDAYTTTHGGAFKPEKIQHFLQQQTEKQKLDYERWKRQHQIEPSSIAPCLKKASTKPEASARSAHASGIFVKLIGDILIEASNLARWNGFTLTCQSPRDIENILVLLLGEYVYNLQNAYVPKTPLKSQSPNTERYLAQCITRNQFQIARYFCENVLLGTDSVTKISVTAEESRVPVSAPDSLFLESFYPDFDVEWTMILTNAEHLEQLLKSSDAFPRLVIGLENLRLLGAALEMDNIEAILSESMHNSSGISPAKVLFTFDWSITNFMRSQYGADTPSIRSVVVLTGSALCAQATTCGEYVTKTWPNSGSFILGALEDVLLKQSGSSRSVGTVRYTRDLSSTDWVARPPLDFHASSRDTLARDDQRDEIEISVTVHNVGVRVTGNRRLIIELAQLFAWLGSALSASPPSGGLAYRRPLLHQEPAFSFPFKGLPFRISFKHEPIEDTGSVCWLRLFYGAVIVPGFTIPERGDEVGLEIPLGILAAVTGACHAVEYDGGIVMKGFSHLLVPIRRSGDRVQWHAISNKDPDKRLSYADAVYRIKKRCLIEELSLSDLRDCRAFLGWCSVAVSRLGSDGANYENIGYSGAPAASPSIKCTGGSLGFQQFGMTGLDFRLGEKDGKCHFQRSGPYRRIISASEKTPVALYDTGERRAWLVSASDVMLHIVRHRNWLESREIDGAWVTLDTNVPVGTTAKDLLLQNESVRLSDDSGETLKDMIVGIWSLLEFLIDQGVANGRANPGVPIKSPFRQMLRGFEFKAVVEERSPFREKAIRIREKNGGWPRLLCDIDALVLMADGFKDLIVPAARGNEGLCLQWRRMPKGCDYLAASTRVLADLFDVAGCRLSQKYLTSTQLQWHQGQSLLFDPCVDPLNARCRCSRLQQIRTASTYGKIRGPGQLKCQGAVIFGSSEHSVSNLIPRFPGRNPKISGIYSQNNVSLGLPDVQSDINALRSCNDQNPNNIPSGALSESEQSGVLLETRGSAENEAPKSGEAISANTPPKALLAFSVNWNRISEVFTSASK